MGVSFESVPYGVRFACDLVVLCQNIENMSGCETFQLLLGKALYCTCINA